MFIRCEKKNSCGSDPQCTVEGCRLLTLQYFKGFQTDTVEGSGPLCLT